MWSPKWVKQITTNHGPSCSSTSSSLSSIIMEKTTPRLTNRARRTPQAATNRPLAAMRTVAQQRSKERHQRWLRISSSSSFSSSSSSSSFAIALAVLAIVMLTQIANGFTPIEINSGEGRKLFGGYRITPKHCRATRTLPIGDPRANGPTICMFNHECAQRSGEVVGACMDGFLFGACCQLPHAHSDVESTLIKDAQNAYYQQHQQQHKLQAQQVLTSPAAGQSYEAYGEGGSSIQQQDESLENAAAAGYETNQQQQQQENGNYPTTQHDIFVQENLDKVYQQLETGSSSGSTQAIASTMATHSNGNGGVYETSNQQNDPQDLSTSAAISEQDEQDNVSGGGGGSSSSTEQAQSGSVEFETESNTVASRPASSKQPPSIHVHKNSVKISSPSSPQHNDDFVMQVLSTLPPDHESEHITFTTEVPMKIASSIIDQTSSESNSFEEEPITQLPPKMDSSVKQVSRPKPSVIPAVEKKEKQKKKPSNNGGSTQTAASNMHHHNHLILGDSEFTHSDITHPGADAVLLEDEQDQQFSTGYGPSPVYANPSQDPSKQTDSSASSDGYNTPPQPASSSGSGSDEKYVLVQTITNDQPSKKAPTVGSGSTTSSAITTHVDSIESIILQLNNSNQGPAYSVINQQQPQTPSYGGDSSQSSADTSQQDEQNNGYGQAAVTAQSPTKYYDEIETKRPEDNTYLVDEIQGQQKYPSSVHTIVSQMPAYLESVTTPLNLNSEDSTYRPFGGSSGSNYLQNEYPSARPAAATTPTPNYGDDTAAVLDEHTMPENSYDDSHASADHLTSEFNKMPAMGIAYPVDMTYVEEDLSASSSDQSGGYGQPISSTISSLKLNNDYGQQPGDANHYLPAYTRRPPSNNEGSNRPIASYIGVISNNQQNNYDGASKQPQPSGNYNQQVPEEIAVSSYTTKVQENSGYGGASTASPSAYEPNRLDSNIYGGDNTPTTAIPSPIASTYGSSTTSPSPPRPQYNDEYTPATSSTSRPVLVTASGTKKPKPKPKPGNKRPTKPRPSTSGSSKKPAKPTTPRPQPTTAYPAYQDAQLTNSYQQLKKPTSAPLINTYNTASPPVSLYPLSTYSSTDVPTKSHQKLSAPTTAGYQQSTTTKQPSNSYNLITKRPSKPHTAPNTKRPVTPQQPSSSYGQQQDSYASASTTHHVKRPSTSTQSTKVKKPTNAYQTQPQPQNDYGISSQSTVSPSYGSNTKTEIVPQPSLSYNQDQHIASSPPKRTSTRRPGSKRPASAKPISTSYVTGPTTPRPPTTFVYHDNPVPPLIIADDKLDAFVHSTASALTGSGGSGQYQAPIYASSATPIRVEHPANNYNTHKKPGFVQIASTVRPPLPTVLITPKPTVINLVTSSSWTQVPSGSKTPSLSSSSAAAAAGYGPTTPIPSTSYVYSPSVTRRPENVGQTPEYVSLPPVTSNDFDDPGYFGQSPATLSGGMHSVYTQQSTETSYPIPSDDRPAFPGYYGPTPTYPTFSVPGDKGSGTIEEETYTSPNDFVNFPPVRNPNLNMSAASSAVTTDLELSTPAFVEDNVLKDKMNTLVHKIVESLQDNFDALAEMIDEPESGTSLSPSYQTHSVAAATQGGTKKPTKKPTRVTATTLQATRPKVTTRKPTVVTRLTTKKPVVTRKTTRRPAVTTRRTTRKPATTEPPPEGAAASVEEIVDEEDGDDINTSDNEIDQDETLSSVAAGGRKIQCGVRPHVKSGRIVGGKGSSFGAFPWQVLVRESTWLGLFTKNKCGGVLITNRYVITAAHCQPGFLASLVAVMGEYDISGDLESKRAVTKNIKRVIVHRQYDPATFENDLALLEMDSPVQFDTHIVPICMPTDNADFTGRMATVTGWGRLKYGGGVPSVLQEVQVPVIENTVCQEMFHTAGHNKKILGSFLCAGYANGQKDSCEGDSGGPLVLQRPDGRYELAGTVSHGIKCAAPYLPGVYMRTTFYKPWLRSITGVK